MKQKLIPAPVDEKNVTTDWLDGIFDNCDRIVCGKNGEIYTGSVSDRPATCYIYGNTILWHIDKYLCGVFKLKEAYAELLKRLQAVDKETPDIVVKYDTSMYEELVLVQTFFFKEEE